VGWGRKQRPDLPYKKFGKKGLRVEILAKRVEELEKVYTETLDELSRVKAFNAEVVEALKKMVEIIEKELAKRERDD
jgi:NADP-dependent 3-hydroxy acid dehydrogenase YdfG